MVEMGARYLVLMLRSRIVNVKVKRGLVDDLEPRGCRVLTPKVDIADKDAFAALLQQCAVKLPPVARSIQATMVLRVRSHNPDPAPYTTNTSNRIPTSPSRPSPTGKPAPPPKVHGSWNLHTLLPQSLDVFSFLSSLAGIIRPQSQANYAAGNTFQDALARHRLFVSEHATTLDLGMNFDQGAVVDDENLARALKSTGWYRPRTMRELEGLLELCCDAATRDAIESEGGQVVCGLELAAAIRAMGHTGPEWMGRPMLRQLRVLDRDRQSGSSPEHTISVGTLIATASTLDASGEIVKDMLLQKLLASLVIPTADIDPSRPVHLYGVDSLVALELRNWFANELRADVAVFDLLGKASCEAIGLLAVRWTAYAQEG